MNKKEIIKQGVNLYIWNKANSGQKKTPIFQGVFFGAIKII